MNFKVRQNPIKMLIGTDWWTDCDDAVAMRVLAQMQKKGQIEILGIGIDACMDVSAVSLDAFMRSEGLPDISIGIDFQATDFGGNPPYQRRLSNLPSKYQSNADCEDAVRLYRRILRDAEEKVEVLEIGFPQILSNLIMSEPDDLCELCGMELVTQKVQKLWIMGGKWDDLVCGKEHNFDKTQRARTAAHYLCENWPSPITFLGWEVGSEVITGGLLRQDDLLHQILCDHGTPNGRSSWDPMLVLMACINDENEAGYSVVRGKAVIEEETGINHFTEQKDGLHQYVVKDLADDDYKHQINDIISI